MTTSNVAAGHTEACGAAGICQLQGQRVRECAADDGCRLEAVRARDCVCDARMVCTQCLTACHSAVKRKASVADEDVPSRPAEESPVKTAAPMPAAISSEAQQILHKSLRRQSSTLPALPVLAVEPADDAIDAAGGCVPCIVCCIVCWADGFVQLHERGGL